MLIFKLHNLIHQAFPLPKEQVSFKLVQRSATKVFLLHDKGNETHANGFGLRSEEEGFAVVLGTENAQQLSPVVKERESSGEGRGSLLYLERNPALFLC